MTENTIETRPFAPTLGDYAAYTFSAFYGQILRGRLGLFHGVCALLIAISLSSDPLLRGDILGALPGLLGYPAFLFVVAPILGMVKILWTAKTVPGMRAERTVRLSPDAVTIRNGNLDVTLAWNTFRTVLDTRKAIYLLRATEGQIILKSAFASPDIARQAVAYARHHVKYASDRKTKVFYETAVAAAPSADERVSPPFDMTFKLFSAMSLRNRFRSVGAVLGLMPTVIGIILFYAWLWRADLMDGHYMTFLTASLGFMAFFLLAAPILAIPLSWKLSQKVPTGMGKRQVAMTADYVRSFGDGFDTRFGWRELRRVARNRKCLFCYVRPQGIIAVPSTAFATQAEADAFFDQAKAWADAARAK